MATRVDTSAVRVDLAQLIADAQRGIVPDVDLAVRVADGVAAIARELEQRRHRPATHDNIATARACLDLPREDRLAEVMRLCNVKPKRAYELLDLARRIPVAKPETLFVKFLRARPARRRATEQQ